MRRSAPRLELMLVVVLAGLVAFFLSFAALRLGVTSMVWRYPAAVIGGYLTFLALMRAWIAWKRREIGWGDASEGVEALIDIAADPDAARVAAAHVPGDAPALFAAGRSGGGGGGANWAGAAVPRGGGSSVKSAGSSVGIDLDWDELWPLVLAAACVLGGVFAIGYVIYAAPVLLAEVALDAAVVSVLYRRLRREDASHWAVTVVRNTWIPVLVLVLMAAGAGWALQKAAPGAQSIGGVVRAITTPE